MYEGVPDYPEPDVWWNIVERNRVDRLWISPTGIRALMKYGDQWHRRHDLSSLKLILCAGEVLNPSAWEWLQKTVLHDKVPVIDHMWQTESGGPIVGNPCGINMLPIKPGSSTIPLPGIDADIVDEKGNSLPVRTKGHFVVRRPFPGLTQTIWMDDERYVETYWKRIPNCYYTGDAAEVDEDGYYYFMGRMDEVIKIAGHRIGTIEVESALVSHPDVAEAAVVGKPDELRGEIAAGFVVLKAGRQPSDSLRRELLKLIRDKLGPIIVLELSFVNLLPKTRSGKILRRLIRSVIMNEPLGDHSTIEDEASLQEIDNAVEAVRESLKSLKN
jgi:acetyl-CoA synthetase